MLKVMDQGKVFGRLRVTFIFRFGNYKSVELVVGQGDVQGRSSVGVRGGNLTMGRGDKDEG